VDQQKPKQATLDKSQIKKTASDARVLREVADELRQLVDNLLDTIDSPEDEHHKGHGLK
tara:strand:+ start:17608 stop:17784 length:177 start_codon:yes stop_codon:yes gene_type:complete